MPEITVLYYISVQLSEFFTHHRSVRVNQLGSIELNTH